MARNKVIKVRCTNSEYDILLGKARVLGMPTASFLRFVGLFSKIKEAEVARGTKVH